MPGILQPLLDAYQQYLELPIATLQDHRTNEIYANRWCVLTGRSLMAPTPHRHYTQAQFFQAYTTNKEIRERFSPKANNTGSKK